MTRPADGPSQMLTSRMLREPITDNRLPDTEQRKKWRDAARARYHSSEEVRRAKIAAIEDYRRRNPEKAQETQNLARKRSRRGIQRAYRKFTKGTPE